MGDAAPTVPMLGTIRGLAAGEGTVIVMDEKVAFRLYRLRP